MINLIYIMLSFFIFGGALMFWINRNKSKKIQQNSLIKYLSYFVIVSFLMYIIYFKSDLTGILFLIILLFGYYELIKTFLLSKRKLPIYFIISLLLYSILAFLFLRFAILKKEMVLFTYIVVVVFDAFSQLIGQLVGKTKLFPKISPNKTVEGLIGGILFSVIFVFLIKMHLPYSSNLVLLLTFLIAFSSVIGDYLASTYKRKYNIKDYSKLIPQHGGVLDRFDSFIFSGAVVFLVSFLY